MEPWLRSYSGSSMHVTSKTTTDLYCHLLSITNILLPCKAIHCNDLTQQCKNFAKLTFNFQFAYSIQSAHTTAHSVAVKHLFRTRQVETICKEQHTTGTQTEDRHTQNQSPGKNCTVFVTIYFWNGTCLPKQLYAKFPLVSAVLHDENFYCATGSLRLERASLHPVKKDKRQRPALTQNSASPTWHSPELRKVCGQKPNSLERPMKPPAKWSWFLRVRWRAGMPAASELQAEREDSPLSNQEIVGSAFMKYKIAQIQQYVWA